MSREPLNILIVDDETQMRHMLRMVLEQERYQVAEAANGSEGLSRLADQAFDMVLCDIRMPEMDGLAFLDQLKARGLETTVIMMSAYGSIDTAIKCMKQGAYDYVSKPFRPDEIILALRKAEERLQLQRENRTLRKELDNRELGRGRNAIVTRSPVMQRVLDMVEKVADSTAPVLVLGETGTGKELIARALHLRSGRRQEPFLAVNCSAIPMHLLESELFGHARGAFTGADRASEGLFGAADGGTLLLDEIGDLPIELQPKLLRVLQEKEVCRVGETRPRRVDVRVVAATARDLSQQVASGTFRSDLYYRLAVVEVHLPPLRERAEDVVALTEFYLQKVALRMGRKVPQVTGEAMAALTGHAWPGNIRELFNVLEKAMLFHHGDVITAADVRLEEQPESPDDRDLSLKNARAELERDYIRRALQKTGGNRTQAARLLDISLRSLLYKIQEYQLD